MPTSILRGHQHRCSGVVLAAITGLGPQRQINQLRQRRLGIPPATNWWLPVLVAAADERAEANLQAWNRLSRSKAWCQSRAAARTPSAEAGPEENRRRGPAPGPPPVGCQG